MEWIFDHLQLVIAIVVVAAWMLRGAARRASGHAEPEHHEIGPDDPEEVERTRRIQEEIRRRILARQQGVEPPPIVSRQPPPLPDLAENAEVEKPEWGVEDSEPAPANPPHAKADAFPTEFPSPAATQTAAMAALLEQQRLLAEQFEQVRAMKLAGSTAVPPLPDHGGMGSAGANAADHRSLRRALRADLAGPPGLRRAVLLREILGEPPGMQRGRLTLPRR
jgi:hypothetical protein